ncbi:MAG: aminotransferase class IV [Verrucomicrobiales bacterium]
MSDQSGEFPVWCNGGLLPPNESSISPFDAGFTLGAGCFETLLALRGEPFEWERHHARLTEGLARLGLRPPDRDMLRAACRETAKAAGLPRLRLRVTVSAGPQLPGGSLDPTVEPTIRITASVPHPVPASLCLATVNGRRNPDSPLAGTKSISYAENLVFLAEARRAGADEALILNTRGEICESATANIFFVRGGILRTPPVESGCLPGVARALVLEDAAILGFNVDTSDCLPGEIAVADEVFLTSSTRGVVAVSALDGKRIPMAPGPMTTRLAEARRQRED